MDQNTVTSYVQAHLVSLRQGDLEAAAEDFAPQLRVHLPGIIDSLPLPFVTTENLSIEAGPDQAVVLNRLVGKNGAVVILRSVWQEIDGRPRIIDGAPVEA